MQIDLSDQKILDRRRDGPRSYKQLHLDCSIVIRFLPTPAIRQRTVLVKPKPPAKRIGG